RRSRSRGHRGAGRGRATRRGVNVTIHDDLIVHIARFGAALRAHGIAAGIGDEIDATRALAVIDLFDRAEVRRAFHTTFKVRPHDRPQFGALFDAFWTVAPAEAPPAGPRRATRIGDTVPRAKPDGDVRAVAADGERRWPADASAPGYTRDVVLRR